jgi:hypothetical protein
MSSWDGDGIDDLEFFKGYFVSKCARDSVEANLRQYWSARHSCKPSSRLLPIMKYLCFPETSISEGISNTQFVRKTPHEVVKY